MTRDVIKPNILSLLCLGGLALAQFAGVVHAPIATILYFVLGGALAGAYDYAAILPFNWLAPMAMALVQWRSMGSMSLKAFASSAGILPCLILAGFLWLIASIGSSSRRQAKDTVKLMTRMRALLVEQKRTGEGLTSEIESLTKRIALDNLPITEVIRFTRRLSGGNQEDVCKAIVEFSTRRLSEGDAYVYVIRDRQLVLAAFVDDEGQVFPNELAGDAFAALPIFKLALDRRRTAVPTDINWTSRPDALDRMTVASPMIDEMGEVTGLLAVRRLRFLGYTSGTFALINEIARCGGTAIASARAVSELGKIAYFDPALKVFTNNYYSLRLDAERARHAATREPLSVLDVKVIGIEKFHRKQQLIVTKILAWVIRTVTTSWDVVALGDTPAAFQIILPGTDVQSTKPHVTRIRAEFESAMARLGVLDLLSIELVARLESTQVGIVTREAG